MAYTTEGMAPICCNSPKLSQGSHLALWGELDGFAERVDQYLRELGLVAAHW
jgi:hypothetical protein